MGDLKAKLRARFSRRNSAAPSLASSTSSQVEGDTKPCSRTVSREESAASSTATTVRDDRWSRHGHPADASRPEPSRPNRDGVDSDRRGGDMGADGDEARGEDAAETRVPAPDASNDEAKLTPVGPSTTRSSDADPHQPPPTSDTSGNDLRPAPQHQHQHHHHHHNNNNTLFSIHEQAENTPPDQQLTPAAAAADTTVAAAAAAATTTTAAAAAPADSDDTTTTTDSSASPSGSASHPSDVTPPLLTARAAAGAPQAASQNLRPAPAPSHNGPQSRATPSSSLSRPAGPLRRQSLLEDRQAALIQTLLTSADPATSDALYYHPHHHHHHHRHHVHNASSSPAASLPPLTVSTAAMVTRKVWVRRPSASPTMVTIHEDDLVDDVRDVILRKYANSLGRQFDAPDIVLRIWSREGRQERVLAPDEPMARTLDAYYPGGQTADEALSVEIVARRTPRASPRAGAPAVPHGSHYHNLESRPPEAGNDYFGPGAVAHLPVTLTAAAAAGQQQHHPHPHSISVLNTGHVPSIPTMPSPGAGGGASRARLYRERPERPQLGRQHTSSPILHMGGGGGGGPGGHANPALALAAGHDMPPPPGVVPTSPMPTPPLADGGPLHRVGTPPPAAARAASPRPVPGARSKKKNKPGSQQQQQQQQQQPQQQPPQQAPSPLPPPAAILNGGVPPINVLIVEDNIINLKLLEAFVKRLKVRWQTAMNGREAVSKWRTGGFHLVLMDIQLPVMSGLDATREIRRLERVNAIGAFLSNGEAAGEHHGGEGGEGGPGDEVVGEPSEEDRLENREAFKSPVIIVALTASSLQSDRHEALAAGCNDFLTKPVNFVWLERKVMEWGCMQALIDFDGWRKWKNFAHADEGLEKQYAAAAAAGRKAGKKKNRQSLTLLA